MIGTLILMIIKRKRIKRAIHLMISQKMGSETLTMMISMQLLPILIRRKKNQKMILKLQLQQRKMKKSTKMIMDCLVLIMISEMSSMMILRKMAKTQTFLRLAKKRQQRKQLQISKKQKIRNTKNLLR